MPVDRSRRSHCAERGCCADVGDAHADAVKTAVQRRRRKRKRARFASATPLVLSVALHGTAMAHTRRRQICLCERTSKRNETKYLYLFRNNNGLDILTENI